MQPHVERAVPERHVGAKVHQLWHQKHVHEAGQLENRHACQPLLGEQQRHHRLGDHGGQKRHRGHDERPQREPPLDGRVQRGLIVLDGREHGEQHVGDRAAHHADGRVGVLAPLAVKPQLTGRAGAPENELRDARVEDVQDARGADLPPVAEERPRLPRLEDQGRLPAHLRPHHDAGEDALQKRLCHERPDAKPERRHGDAGHTGPEGRRRGGREDPLEVERLLQKRALNRVRRVEEDGEAEHPQVRDQVRHAVERRDGRRPQEHGDIQRRRQPQAQPPGGGVRPLRGVALLDERHPQPRLRNRVRDLRDHQQNRQHPKRLRRQQPGQHDLHQQLNGLRPTLFQERPEKRLPAFTGHRGLGNHRLSCSGPTRLSAASPAAPPLF